MSELRRSDSRRRARGSSIGLDLASQSRMDERLAQAIALLGKFGHRTGLTSDVRATVET